MNKYIMDLSLDQNDFIPRMDHMKKNKIIIINHYGITPDMPGATKHYDMAKYFAAKGEYDVEFWMCGYNHVTGEYVNGLKGYHLQFKYIDNNVKIVKIKSIPDWGSLLMRQLNIMCFDFITGIKLLFGRNIKAVVLSIPPITFFATDAMRLKHIKMIADVEDLWPLFVEDMGMRNRIASTYMNYFADHSYNAATAIESVSNGMLEYIRKRVKDKGKKTWMAPLGVNLDLVRGNIDRSYVEKYKWKDDFIIMYAGAHGKANDLESVLLTIKRFNKKYSDIEGKKIAFVFIGDGDNKEKLVYIKNKYNITNVYFEDAVPGNVISQILKNADVCLTNLKKIKSFKLVRPNKIFQYMAAGKPIICGIWGEAAQVVSEADTGIYIDFTEINAAEKIYNFIIKEDLKKLGENGYKYIVQNGNREKIFEEFYNNLKEIIE